MSTFHFKQFAISQDRCAMKIGTDSTLLGAWAKVTAANRILDIGTGTGVLALMSAQRNETASILGIEYEEEAFLQASENIALSPWANRVQVYHQAIQDFESVEYFDAIISNPPFYPIDTHLQSTNPARNLARATKSLEFEELLAAVSKLLCPKTGVFSIILPIEVATIFSNMASTKDLYLIDKTNIIPREGKTVNRVLMAFSKVAHSYTASNLMIRTADKGHHNYSEAFRHLLKDFLIIF
jgi:tRNA1Val (adenine37-N6)-methyltransferase